MSGHEDLPTQPQAVLVGFNGLERVVSIPIVLPELYLPAAQSRCLAGTPCEIDQLMQAPRRRVFRLNLSVRVSSHRWLRVYNDGRSATPEDGYLYQEVRG